MLIGFIFLWAVMHGSATWLGSYRGEWGMLVGIAVVAAALLWERLIGQQSVGKALGLLGLGKPTANALLWAGAISAALVCFFPVYALVFATPIDVREDWPWLLPGLFAQAGLAEETIFRGYLFRHLRENRTFWSAATLSAVPFTVIHLVLLSYLDAKIALASLVVALSLSFPLAWLFEQSKNSVWPAAVVHFVIQGAIKIVELPQGQLFGLATSWMATCSLAPWLFFLVLGQKRDVQKTV
jgi:membrane protease YdiL (CAAX protease family)